MELIDESGYRITDKIYVSGEYEANDPAWLKENGITGILNVSTRPDHNTGDLVSYHLGFPDDIRATDDEVKKAVKALQYMCGLHERVLVHCAAGVSRSPTVVAIYLALKTGNSFKHSLDFVAQGRKCVFPADTFIRRGQRLVDELRTEGK